jgi:ATP-binding protein involved in chromosome partitioning
VDEVIDPRVGVIEDRLRAVDRIIAITGSKGGIGKTVAASLLALTLADRGWSVGLLDLDFTSPTDHVVLGAPTGFPVETFGLDPHAVAGVNLMSVAFMSGAAPTPLRGADTTNAMLELFAVTQWGALDTLVIDMPPGLGDTSLDVLRYVPQVEFLLIATASRLVIDSVRRAAALLTELQANVVGVVANQARSADVAVERLADDFGLQFAGSVPFDPGLEAALGDVEALRRTEVYAALGRVSRVISP